MEVYKMKKLLTLIGGLTVLAGAAVAVGIATGKIEIKKAEEEDKEDLRFISEMEADGDLDEDDKAEKADTPAAKPKAKTKKEA